MRLLMINVLVAGMLLFSAASASAYAINMTTTYDGHNVTASETITVDVWLDTEGQSDIKLLTVGVVFDATQLIYDTVNSDADNYVLYEPGTGATPLSFLAPAIPNGGHIYDPPELIIPDQVNVDQHAYKVTPTSVVSANAHLATLIFHVANPTATSLIWLTIDGTRGGTVFQLGDNSRPGADVTSSITVNVPEPTTALLIGLGLVGLGVAGRRRE